MDGKVGVVIDRGKEEDQLEIAVAFQEKEKSPKLGEFLIIEEREFMRKKELQYLPEQGMEKAIYEIWQEQLRK